MNSEHGISAAPVERLVRRRGYRLMTLPSGGVWQYKIGRSNVVAYSAGGRKLVAGHDVILGLTWPEIERYRWKNRGSNHRANVTPAEVAEWIERAAV